MQVPNITGNTMIEFNLHVLLCRKFLKNCLGINKTLSVNILGDIMYMKLFEHVFIYTVKKY